MRFHIRVGCADMKSASALATAAAEEADAGIVSFPRLRRVGVPPTRFDDRFRARLFPV
jgi:hypothetical protein